MPDYDRPGCQIGKVLADVFRDLRWSKAEFSRRTDVEAAQVGKYYTGKQTPTPARLEEWSKIPALAPYTKAFSEAWDADESKRLAAKKADRRRRRPAPDAPIVDPEAADAMLAITALVRKFPSIAVPLRRRAQALARVERGELDEDSA